MNALLAAVEFARTMADVSNTQKLEDALAQVCARMGIRFFALSHHVDFASAPFGLRIHNYPDGWQDWYDANRLGLSDPIHRASHKSVGGFLWRDVPHIIPINANDKYLLAKGRRIGLGEGVTVPTHVPGEACGSCTFVAQSGVPLPEDVLPWAQLVGTFAFEGARRIARRKTPPPLKLSERQRQCVALAGRGKSNRQIAAMLGIGEQTVMEHMREARQKLGVSTRTQLVVRLLADGNICFDDIMKR